MVLDAQPARNGIITRRGRRLFIVSLVNRFLENLSRSR